VNEFELISTYFARGEAGEGVVVGIGDDGAVLTPEPGMDLVTVVDTLVEGTHFPPDIDPFAVGFRAVAVNLSDIAAMGARPRWMTLALTIPAPDSAWLERFADGLHTAAAEHGVALVGGDTTSGRYVVATVQVTGEVEPGRMLLRSGAEVGDTIYVTGTVGDAAAGLALLAGKKPQPFLVSRFLRPSARVAFGRALAGHASAAIDVSDGLLGDLGKLLAASRVGGVIEVERLPLSADLVAAFDPGTARRFALSGGDDYELCFTARPGPVPDPGELRVTAIGRVTAGRDLSCLEHGEPLDCHDSGYTHFE
jgi:thiamine-monophosphate kinase